ncbi:hypothetical protein IV203_003813 [Nitzschia inconspicua]|uniref:Transmembrane protein n=1 Tax=Nitzschia inconspicua TaxID=303405 RepID=A0A9K3L326_9STRA|nr:hypothetical protein IV203_003813 [Nitzschia inconspicua]
MVLRDTHSFTVKAVPRSGLFVFAILLFWSCTATAFVLQQHLPPTTQQQQRFTWTTTRTSVRRAHFLPSWQSESMSRLSTRTAQTTTTTSTRLFEKKKQVVADGTQRGAYLLGVVLLACLWIFSVPPEFRRAYLCGTERCVQDRQAYLCNDCVTPEEWKRGIVEYYRNGGGVHFDFSVDPNSKLKVF